MKVSSSFLNSKIGLISLILSISLIFLGCSDDEGGGGAPVEPPKPSITFTLTTVPATLPAESRWIITDGGNTATKTDFDALETLLNIKEAKGRKIELEFPNIETIPAEAFYNTTDKIGVATIVSVSAKKATIIENNAFNNSTKLANIDFPLVTIIGSNAFLRCTELTTADFPEVRTIEVSAFSGCTVLKTVNFPKATTLGANAFSGCKVLDSVTFPMVTSIGGLAFLGCTALQTVDFPLATTIEAGAFSDCTNLEKIEFLLVTTIGSNAFKGCTKLKEVNFPEAKSIDGNTFQGCTALQTVKFPLVTNIKEYAFLGCTALRTMIIATTSILTTLDPTAFDSSPKDKILVTTGGVENKEKFTSNGFTEANITVE